MDLPGSEHSSEGSVSALSHCFGVQVPNLQMGEGVVFDANVEFIDFGNVEVVGLESMRQLHPKLTTQCVPPFALHINDYVGQQLMQDSGIDQQQYDSLMDGRIVTIKLEEQPGHSACKGRVFAYLDESVHSLQKSADDDVTLQQLDYNGFTKSLLATIVSDSFHCPSSGSTQLVTGTALQTMNHNTLLTLYD